MKEKIKLILLVVVFIGLLFVVNSLLEKSELKPEGISSVIEAIKEENAADEMEVNEVEEETIILDKEITTKVVASSGENTNASETEKKDSNTENVNSTVLEVTEATFDEEVLKSEKKVLIDFYATWCNPCKILSPIVEEVAKENPDLKVVKIDVDKNENLASKYRAYSIPTLVVIKNGEVVNRAVGAIPKEDVLDLIK